MTITYGNNGVDLPVKLAIFQTSVEDVEKGCILGNVGARMQLGRRVFYLTRFNAAFSIGKLYGLDDATAATLSAEIVGASGTGFDQDYAAGISQFSITDSTHLSSVVEDAYEGGYIFFTNGLGEGQCLAIKGNSENSGNTVIFDTFDPTSVALDADATDFRLMKNPYTKPVISDAGAEGVGWTLGVAAVSSSTGTTPTSSVDIYTWLQTWGPASVFSEDTGTEGARLVHSDGGSHDGACADDDDALDGFIGTRIAVGTSTADYTPVFLMITP